MCARMYADKKYVYSGLMTGTMWDVVMRFISEDENNNYSDLKNTKSGNYANTTLNNIKGQYIGDSDQQGSTVQVVNANTINGGNRYGILSTASSDDTRNHNIYDLEGNLWEWTQEACWTTKELKEAYMLRGGCYNNQSSISPAYCRGHRMAY